MQLLLRPHPQSKSAPGGFHSATARVLSPAKNSLFFLESFYSSVEVTAVMTSKKNQKKPSSDNNEDMAIWTLMAGLKRQRLIGQLKHTAN